jgi:putative restriction endonuclease
MTDRWTDAVEAAVRRHVSRTESRVFTRQELVEAELQQIIVDTGSQGSTPQMTLSRELQEMRDRGTLEFIDDRGTYRLIG